MRTKGTGGSDQFTGFEADDLEVFGFRDVKIAAFVCVYDFTFAHCLCGIGEDCHRRIISAARYEH